MQAIPARKILVCFIEQSVSKKFSQAIQVLTFSIYLTKATEHRKK